MNKEKEMKEENYTKEEKEMKELREEIKEEEKGVAGLVGEASAPGGSQCSHPPHNK